MTRGQHVSYHDCRSYVWKKLLMAKIKPTPAPQIKRPTTMTVGVVDAVSRIHPMVKIKQPPVLVHRRLMKSAISSAFMAPNKVPQERILLNNDCSHDLMMKCWWEGFFAHGW